MRIPAQQPGVTRSLRICVFLLAACGISWLSASAQVKSPASWLPLNFDTTIAGNYRGARITSKAQLDSMKRVYGITTVINLAKDALPKTGGTEIEWAKELGLSYEPFYLASSPPSPRQWSRIKELLAAGRAYVHCAHGADRTGAIIAKYRTEVEGMPSPDAWREARRFGFKPWLKDLRAWVGF